MMWFKLVSLFACAAAVQALRVPCHGLSTLSRGFPRLNAFKNRVEVLIRQPAIPLVPSRKRPSVIPQTVEDLKKRVEILEEQNYALMALRKADATTWGMFFHQEKAKAIEFHSQEMRKTVEFHSQEMKKLTELHNQVIELRNQESTKHNQEMRKIEGKLRACRRNFALAAEAASDNTIMSALF